MEKDILLVEKKGYVTTLTLNRPDKRNSLSPALLLSLSRTLDELSQDDHVRTVVIRGTGDKAFSAGFDISALATDVTMESQQQAESEHPLETCIQSVMNFPYPVVAMLNGFAFGAGCELAVSCDLRIGADDIRIGMPPAKLGIVYPLQGLRRFVQVVGISQTRELFLTGRYYPAKRGFDIGLLNHVVPRSELEAFTYKLAEEMAGNAPLSLKGTKRILGMLAETIPVPEMVLQEADRIVTDAFNSEDLKEAQAAFMEKRKPSFKGQ